MGTSWTKHLKQEFTREKRSLKTKHPQLILLSQWKFHPYVWLIYRIFTAVYTLVWCICSGVQTHHPKWFIFLTHLTYVVLTFYFNLALVNLICHMVHGQKRPTQNIRAASLEEISSCNPVPEIEVETPALKLHTQFDPPSSVLYPTICIQWCLYNLSCVTSLFVTIAFWSFDYIPGRAPDSININMHVINSVLVLLELSVAASPIHLAHFVYTLMYCLSFIIFTVIYWAAGGTNLKGKAYIYRSLNYSETPGAAVGCIIGSICLLMPFLQFVVWNIHFLKYQAYLRFNWKDGTAPQC
ncbi:protein rolling stone [Rhincodon typus]|uniref:protein rolling stone n=1 Tax=Rhincodon typus TaxID=259920 RepID=UPI00202EAD31|nr:protein rolling stone [Rhincodon typus]